MQQPQRPHVKGGMQLAAQGNGQVPVAAARPLPLVTLTDVDDTKTHQLVRILSTYNLRRLHLFRSLSNDELATTLLYQLRQNTEREYLRVLKA